MGAIKRNIPNFFTCLNLVCGVVGIMMLIRGYVIYAVYPMFLAGIFDFLDGFLARLLKVTSPIGKDLDSLADIVTFGVLPGLLMYQLLLVSQGAMILQHNELVVVARNKGVNIITIAAVLIPVFSAIRLAKFNNDPDQGYYFKGLATPACGLFVAAFTYWVFNLHQSPITSLYEQKRMDFVNTVILHPGFLVGLTVALSALLVSNLKLMAFKFKGFGWKANQWKYILLILCLPLILLLGFASAPIILILYILISQIHFRTKAHEI
jgi:CDP-diacylglycerol--serine O-phosphatidyltransferase